MRQRDVAVLGGVRVRAERGEHRPGDRGEPDERGDDQEGVEDDPRDSVSGRLRTRAGVLGDGDARHACSVSRKLFQTKTTIGTIEITIRITAIAEP